MRSQIVLFSYHHHNTEKVANVIAKVLDAQIKTPQQVNPEELPEYDLIGFGSGIYSERHHKSILALSDGLPHAPGKKAFIFSTNGAPGIATKGGVGAELLVKNHRLLKEKLILKGYAVVDEFTCAGYNTNSFLKVFGGINKGWPDAEDLRRAEEFARNLKHKLQ